MKDILLSELWHPNKLIDYKVHFARWNQHEQPLHALARKDSDWMGWQQYFPGRNDFNRKYIFSLAQMPGAQDIWMFGGIWAVNQIIEGTNAEGEGYKYYDVEAAEELSNLILRLKLHRVHRSRTTRVNLENHFSDFIISEILPNS